MNNIINKKGLIKMISEQLTNQRIVVGGNEKVYKRKYRLKYSKKIIDTIINAFWEAITDAIENGDSVKLYDYVKIEPYLRKETTMNANGFKGINEKTVPAHYTPKFRAGRKLKEACKTLSDNVSGNNTL